ncbi:hypothetical protein [Olivibacter sitiensis]|uniref:hypothetical protein n=1 Tax=Olivibacter sitiensis TaxID=376470 RepID=UPI0003FBEB5C|nr:hypothetical protein [Olivibacter sitiensis]
MKQYINISWLILLVLALGSCSKDKEDCDPDDEESPCYAGLGASKGECWYSLAIDGATTLPNTFGQDKMILVLSANPENGGGFVFDISQAKANSSNNALFTLAGYALLNSKLPKGSYPGVVFQTMPFSTPEFTAFPLYTHTEGGYMHPGGYKLPNFTVDVLENSAQRLWLKMSGMAFVVDVDSPGVERTAEVELEMKMGRKHFTEIVQNGELVGGATCDCQK